MSSATWASTAALLRARRDFQAAFAASRLHLLQIFCFSATERQATLGCGLPKFHRQVLTSYTWLPLPVCYPWRGPSAQPNAKSRLCRAAYSPDSVELHISCKFSPLCLFDMDIQKVGKKLRSNCHHGLVGNHSLPSVCKSPKNPCNCLIRYEWVCFSFFVFLDQIWSLQSCHVPVDNGRYYMFPVKSYEPLMQLILGTLSQNIEVMDPHPSIGRKELVPRTLFSLYMMVYV